MRLVWTEIPPPLMALCGSRLFFSPAGSSAIQRQPVVKVLVLEGESEIRKVGKVSAAPGCALRVLGSRSPG